MKNKWLRRKVLAIILVLAMCPVPVYSEESCDHNYVENSRVDPTCTSAGQIVWECSKCHDMQTETLPQAAHNYVETVMVAPTCKGKYASDFKCSSCGDSYTEVYDPLPHNPVFHDHIDVGNCSTNGWDRYICSGCGQYFDEDVPGDPTIHSYGTAVVVKGPTCTDTGLSRETCTGCGATVDTVIPAIGGTHVMVCDPSQTVNPTCSEEGKTVWVCMHGACSYTEVTTIPKLSSHSWNDVGVAVEPTCSAPGVMNTKCYYCGTESTRELMQLTHSWKEIETVPAQCNKDGYVLLRCWDCGAEITETIHMGTVPHNHVKVDAESKAATCKEDGVLVVRCTGCGDTVSSLVSKLTVPHTYQTVEEKAATCADDGYLKEKCSVCGDDAITSYPADGTSHHYNVTNSASATCISDGFEDRTCEYCGDLQHEVISKSPDYHAWVVDTATSVAPTCIADGKENKKCSLCSAETTQIIPYSGHSWDAGTELIAPDCINDGQVQYVCTTCGEFQYEHPVALGHEYVYDYFLEATCINPSKDIFSCTRCGATEEQNVGSEYGDHAFVEISATNPTCGDYGVSEKECVLCGASKQDIIPATGEHSWKILSETLPNNCIDGEYVEECKKCGEIRIETIPGNDEHSWKIDAELKPTCAADGYIKYVCEFCADTKQDTLPATDEHSWSMMSETAATCENEGSKTYECADCGEDKSEVIPALGHDWVETGFTDATCAADGASEKECTVCGAVKTDVIPATGEHLWTLISKAEASCKEEGSADYECETCGKAKSETLKKTGHSYGSWKIEKQASYENEGRKARKCKVCGHKQVRSIARIDALYVGVDAWDAVHKLQQDLESLGYLQGKPDGFFGPITEKAVMDFQQASGIEVNGIADAATLAMIAAALEKGEAGATAPEFVPAPADPKNEAVPVENEANIAEASETAVHAVVYDNCKHVVNENGVVETYFCEEHQMLMTTCNMLIDSAATDAALVKALNQSAAMWGVELDFLYHAWMDAVAPENRPMIVNSMAMFSANLQAQEFTWNQMYGEESVEAVSRVNEMVISQCVDLCELIHGLNAAEK